MERWSSKNHWVERARNHDKELARVAYEEEAMKVKAMAARHAKLGLALQNKGIMALNDVGKEEMDLKTSFYSSVRAWHWSVRDSSPNWPN